MIRKLFATGHMKCHCIDLTIITEKDLPLMEAINAVKGYMRDRHLTELKVKSEVFKTRPNELSDTALFLNKQAYNEILGRGLIMDNCNEFHIINYGKLSKIAVENIVVESRKPQIAVAS